MENGAGGVKIKLLKNKSIPLNVQTVCLCVFIFIILHIFLYRIVRGADMTDETFYATLSYRLVKGNALLKDMWEQCSTSAIFPSILLRIKQVLVGSLDGIVLFFRLSFFAFNFGAAVFLYYVQKQFLKKEHALLLSLFYLIYAPFHLYTFSYNHLSDVFIMLIINSILLAKIRKNRRLFFLAGCFCAFLAFTYPTMLFLCPVLVLLLFIKNKALRNGWIFFIAGGFSFAIITCIVLLSTIGFTGILTGAKGILSDPAYSLESLPISQKLLNALQYLFTPFSDEKSLWIRLYLGWLFIVFIFRKKSPVLKLSIGLYPIVVGITLFPHLPSMGVLGISAFILYLSLPCPLFILFTDKHKRIFCDFLYFEWLPVLLFYFVLSVSSFGGASQAVQSLIIAAFVSLKEILLILDETIKSLDLKQENLKQRAAQWAPLFLLSVAITGELHIHYNYVYRDYHVINLTEKIQIGPYKGIYTTPERKIFLEEMTKQMSDLQETEKTVCILYQSNFAYLMLDMVPATPTTWGIYPHMDNQVVYSEYFKSGKHHIPERIFIVDVPQAYDSYGQREEHYEFCEPLKTLLSNNYTLLEERSISETGHIKKYALSSDEKTFQQSLQQIFHE